MKTTNFKRALALVVGACAMTLMLVSCDGKVNVKQDYGFDLVTMPVPKRLAEGETAEIRCTIVREGDYTGTKYYIRYFQPDGVGELRMDDKTLFTPNDLYPLDRTVFRLYYTARCSDQQNIDIYIEDSWGRVVMKSFSWQNKGSKDDDEKKKEE